MLFQDPVEMDRQNDDAPPENVQRMLPQDAENYRDLLAEWFAGVGSLPDQNEWVFRT